MLGAIHCLRAEEPFRICIYGDNRGASRTHRVILRQAKEVSPRLFVIDGDVVKFDYGRVGTPDAVLQDYRTVFRTAENSLAMWPATPGPVVLVAAGGHDEQYFLDPETAALADTSPGRRYAYEGTNELGVRLYDAFNLDQMRLRVQSLADMEQPLPMSRYGDYLLIAGSGPHRECALLVLYRTDRWGFRPQQVDWVDSSLADLRKQSPGLPLIAVAHDWTWFLPDTLDDGHLDGVYNGIRDGSPRTDRRQKQRLFRLMHEYRVDLAVASDLHAYWADASGPLLRINCAAAVCDDPHGERVAQDNVWLEYVQTPASLRVVVHPVEAPAGCGLRPEAAAFGLLFEKNRRAGAEWRSVANP